MSKMAQHPVVRLNDGAVRGKAESGVGVASALAAVVVGAGAG